MNTIRELKQQEKYKNMLKRKNKEKKIYKDKNASLQFEKQKLYIALLNREKEIERLKELCDKYEEEHKTTFEEWKKTINIINELEKWLLEENKKKQKWYNEQLSTNDKRYYEEKYLTSLTMINVFFDKLQELKGSVSND